MALFAVIGTGGVNSQESAALDADRSFLVLVDAADEGAAEAAAKMALLGEGWMQVDIRRLEPFDPASADKELSEAVEIVQDGGSAVIVYEPEDE